MQKTIVVEKRRISYFFAHDHQNYARLLPLYISTMQETEKMHPDLWAEFRKENFCVSKGMAGFTSIAPDHGIEQENWTMKNDWRNSWNNPK